MVLLSLVLPSTLRIFKLIDKDEDLNYKNAPTNLIHFSTKQMHTKCREKISK